LDTASIELWEDKDDARPSESDDESEYFSVLYFLVQEKI
jgi:hypothetical protein